MPTTTKRRKGKAQKPSFFWEPSRHTRAILLLCFIVLFAAIRFRLRQMPLERDEGEYAYAGQLILQGVPPYELAYNMKLPGTYAAYAVIMAVLGQTPSGIHLGLLLLNAATMVLVYVLSAELFGGLAGIVAAATYGLLSTSASVMGLAAHATHFVVFAAVAGLIVLLRAIERKQYWLYLISGVLLGLAFVMKQPGIFFCLFGALLVIQSEWARPIPWRNLLRRLGVLLAGMLLPYALTCFILWRAGVFKKFWFWTVSYASQYGMIKSLSDGAQQFLKIVPGIVEHSLLVWIVAALGITALWWHAQARLHRGFALGFLIFSFLAVCPGFYFRNHYFILMLPAVAILVGIAVRSAFYSLGERTSSGFIASLPVVAFLVVFAIALLSQHEVLFEMDPVAATWFTYGAQPFEQALSIGDYIRTHSNPNDRVAVLGSEPEIYFYAHRHSATGYIYTYPLMEPQAYALKMQNEMISEVEQARPEFVVMVWFPVSWLRREDSNDHILDWMKEFMRSQYEVVGVAHVLDEDGNTEYRWGNEAAAYQTQSPLVAYILRRRV
jgi:4-amino-4-deoxy-L-arabinose transferase-like glycosyltransferase